MGNDKTNSKINCQVEKHESYPVSAPSGMTNIKVFIFKQRTNIFMAQTMLP